MSDNDLRATKWVSGLIILAFLLFCGMAFGSAYMHGKNSAPKIDNGVVCMYGIKNAENTTAKEWICERAK